MRKRNKVLDELLDVSLNKFLDELLKITNELLDVIVDTLLDELLKISDELLEKLLENLLRELLEKLIDRLLLYFCKKNPTKGNHLSKRNLTIMKTPKLCHSVECY